MTRYLMWWFLVSVFLFVLIGGPYLYVYLTHNQDIASEIGYSGIENLYRLIVACPIGGAAIAGVVLYLARYSK